VLVVQVGLIVCVHVRRSRPDMVCVHVRRSSRSNCVCACQAFKEACALLSRDGTATSMPTALKAGDALVDRFFLLKDNGPKSKVNL
jgi:hypothetical protein